MKGALLAPSGTNARPQAKHNDLWDELGIRAAGVRPKESKYPLVSVRRHHEQNLKFYALEHVSRTCLAARSPFWL